MVDAAVDIRVGAFERGIGIDWHWVGYRPVQPKVWPSSSWALSQTATTRSSS